jgi:hypothetical protein
MSRLKLADADRERLGGPEFLTNPLDSVTVREAIELQKLGYTTPTMLARALVPRKSVGDDGAEVDEGPDYLAWTAFVWLALRRGGVQCDPATLDFDIVSLAIVPDEEPVEPKVVPGKAPAREGSTNSAKKNSTSGVTSQERLTPTVSVS